MASTPAHPLVDPKLRKAFDALCYGYGYSEVFTAFLDFALWMLNPNKTKEAFEQVQYIDRMFPEKDAPKMGALFKAFVDATDNRGEGFHDALGDLFMECVSFGRNGQFFTPQPICDMMAQLTYGDQLQDGQSVTDPACGSGRTLLGIARLNRKLKFYGADNDITCCKMAVLNMLLNSMPGEIAWMDSLRMEHYRSWHIKLVLDGTGNYVPYYYVTGKGETNFLKGNERQQPAKPQPPRPPKPPVPPRPPQPPKPSVPVPLPRPAPATQARSRNEDADVIASASDISHIVLQPTLFQ